MADHLCIDAATGTLAVWTGGTDLGPVTNPDAHPTRTRFNSRQENLGFIATPRTGSVSIAGWASDSLPVVKRAMFAHGLGYRPFLMGYLTIGGRQLPIHGSILHTTSSSDPRVNFSYTVGVDNTNVFLNIMRFTTGTPSGLPSSLNYTIYMSVYGVTSGGDLRRPPYFDGVDANAGGPNSYVRAGYFDSNYRYPYRNSSGPLALPNGRTISTGIGWNNLPSGSGGSVALGWRYSVLGHVVQRNVDNIGSLISGATGNSASFNASTTRIGL